ncbi:Sec-independent protein translocase subunit TatA/TatB [Ferruginibacter albus]|uniref:Sec-independent protein translocase subunit TatA/TatB n=1 Tax=Ferruginibacter albus TaxID=2875540 RepID=UPI001CC4AD8D|nr:twin-arginine translocase TatA/TatE family subunit [Ferruginibacter albus]UAY51276.1 twin-arginine translocase TatA/TatE family subunit [Ferruginibacter albus]
MIVSNFLLIPLSIFAPEHLIMIAFVVLLLFGGKKIPELMRGLGKGVKEFNDAKTNVTEQIQKSIDTDESAKDKELEELRNKVQLLQQTK